MRTARNSLLMLVMVVMLPGCCCFDRCRPNCTVFGRPAAEVVRPPSDWCWGNCPVDRDAHEAPAYVTPMEGVPGVS